MERIDTDSLIFAVQTYPPLWQESHKDLKNKRVTDKLWNKVGEVSNCSGATAKSKWKNLKDTYRRILRKMVRESLESDVQPSVRWQYFDMMSFVKMQLAPNAPQGNLREPQEYAFAQNCTSSNLTSTSYFENISQKKSNKRKKDDYSNSNLLELKKKRHHNVKQEEDNDETQFCSEKEEEDSHIIPDTSTPSNSCSNDISQREANSTKTKVYSDTHFFELKDEIQSSSKQEKDKKENNIDDIEFHSEEDSQFIPDTSTSSSSCSNKMSPKKSKNKKRGQVYLKSKCSKKQVENPNEDNNDMQFFKSLLPFLQTFNKVEKLEIRGEIQNIILAKLKNRTNDHY